MPSLTGKMGLHSFSWFMISSLSTLSSGNSLESRGPCPGLVSLHGRALHGFGGIQVCSGLLGWSRGQKKVLAPLTSGSFSAPKDKQRWVQGRGTEQSLQAELFLPCFSAT